MADYKNEKCAHPACACHGSDDSRFCSAFCEGASDRPDIVCNCGHAGCRSQSAVDTGRTFSEPVEEMA